MAWPLLVKWIVSYLASQVVGELLRPKLRIENASAAGAADFDVPTADEARRIPWIAGTVRLEGPNVVWWGDLFACPYRVPAGRRGFMGMGNTNWQTIAYQYCVGMHLALCLGPAELLEIRMDDKVLWNHALGGVDPISTSVYIPIENMGLFGGEKGGGGITGVFRYLPGDQTHTVDPYLQLHLGALTPAWRGVASLIWHGPNGKGWNPTKSGITGYLGTSPRIWPVAATMRRLYSALGLSAAQTNLNGNANPAETIYYLATADEDDGGMAMPVELIDVPSLIAAGQQLAEEEFGIAITWDNGDEVGKVIDEICKTIDGTWYLDFRTGKWTLALARGGYDVDSLLVLDEDDITIENWSDTTLDETTNEVVVTYRSRRLDLGDGARVAGGYLITDKQVIAQNMANRHAQGSVISQEIRYPLISQGTLAGKVAYRDLRALDTPLTKVDLIANRSAYKLKPGECFKLSFAPKGVANLVMRVQRVSPGNLLDGSVRISCVRDVFGMSSVVYVEPAPSGWTNPVRIAAACPAQQVLEAPYHLSGVESGKLLVMAQRPNGSCHSYEIWSRTTEATFSYAGLAPAFCPVGTLTVGLAAASSDGTLTFTGGLDVGILAAALVSEIRLGENLAYFETGEVVSFQSFTSNGDGTFTLSDVWRGLLDSVPQAHAIGERIWFGAYGQSTTDALFATGTTVKVKLLPVSARDTLPLTGATEASRTFTGRATKPYPPALPRVQGVDALSTSVGDMVATWRHRNRLTQTQVTRQDDPAEAAPEGTYTVKVYLDGTLVRTLTTGGTAATATYTPAMRVADGTDGLKAVVVGITSSAPGGNSAEARTQPVVMTGLGMCLGCYLGGNQQ